MKNTSLTIALGLLFSLNSIASDYYTKFSCGGFAPDKPGVTLCTGGGCGGIGGLLFVYRGYSVNYYKFSRTSAGDSTQLTFSNGSLTMLGIKCNRENSEVRPAYFRAELRLENTLYPITCGCTSGGGSH